MPIDMANRSPSFGALWAVALVIGAAAFAVVVAAVRLGPGSAGGQLTANVSVHEPTRDMASPDLAPSVVDGTEDDTETAVAELTEPEIPIEDIPTPVPATRPEPEPPPFATEVVPNKAQERSPTAPVEPGLPWAAPKKTYTLAQRLKEIGPGAKARLRGKFESQRLAWPPREVTLVALKDQKVLELYARPRDGSWQFVHRYAVLGASGTQGPKLKQGDKQVPEGIYGIALLNPNSKYHVSLRVSYPNAFDQAMATKDGRKELGGDIMIHGKNVSIGCLAVGDEAAEEIFVLAHEVGLKRVRVIIAPSDLRLAPAPDLPEGAPAWVPGLYAEIANEMKFYPVAKVETAKSIWAWW
ncbi:MAG: hypothetical protein NW216_02170 [Hyphomicrobium sp.]|nr:hypothetical protein [Hyphomicrobium sp.]